MRYIEIDGERHEVQDCQDCPCYDHGDTYAMCRHPANSYRQCYKTDGLVRTTRYWRKPNVISLRFRCPLREVGE